MTGIDKSSLNADNLSRLHDLKSIEEVSIGAFDPLKSERSRLSRLSKSALSLINNKNTVHEFNKKLSIKSKVPAANLLQAQNRSPPREGYQSSRQYDSAKTSAIKIKRPSQSVLNLIEKKRSNYNSPVGGIITQRSPTNMPPIKLPANSQRTFDMESSVAS